MASLKETTKEIIVNGMLFKCVFFLLLIVPTSPKIFNVNAYRFFGVAAFTFIQCIIVYGLLGHIMRPENEIDVNTKCQIMFVLACSVLILVLLFTLLFKSKDVLGLSTMINVDYFTSTRSCQHVEIFYEYCNLSIKIAYIFAFLTVTCTISWATFPILINTQQRDVRSNHDYIRRYENVINLQFPVTTVVFNDYYLVFYAMEVMVTIYLATMNMAYNVFFIVISFALIGQYEVIKKAFEDISHDLIIIENTDGK